MRALLLALMLPWACAHGFGDLPLAKLNYEFYASQGGWTTVGDGPLLKQGVCHPTVSELRSRLRVTDDYRGEDPEQPLCMEPALEGAVERFQARHGLDGDGIVGRETKRYLNVRVEEKLRRIEFNTKKTTGLPDRLPDHYVWVNVANFELQIVKHGKVMMRMKVIAGKTDRQTPEFVQALKNVVFNPYWNVPAIIVNRDLIPKIRKDPEYFAKTGIRIYRSWEDRTEMYPAEFDWTKYSWDGKRFPHVLRQDPGPSNFLGSLKFLMPNRFGVYIHDTPSKHLFDTPVRTYSSGCVRIQEPSKLAAYLLGIPLEEVNERLSTGEHKWEKYDGTLPVFITYYTVWVDEHGAVHFRDDFYDREEWSTQALTCNEKSVHNTCEEIEKVKLSEAKTWPFTSYLD